MTATAHRPVGEGVLCCRRRRHARTWLAAWSVALALALPCLALGKPSVADTAPMRLHVHLHGIDEDRRPPLERLSRDAVRRVEEDLVARLHGDLHIDFVGSPADFKSVMDAHGVVGWPEAWIAGLALLGQDRVIVQVGGPGALKTAETVRHEMAHVALHALSGGGWTPRWYHEGVAMWLAGEATYERLKEAAGAGAFGTLDSLADLDGSFDPQGNQVAVERSYAVAAGFVRFSVVRMGDRRAIVQLHERMMRGLDFRAAWTATFGMAPEALFALYVTHLGTHGSAWTVALSDGLIWGLVSVLALLATATAWRHRPRYEPDDEPLDLEAIAEAGRAALDRPWLRRDFAAAPLQIDATDNAQWPPAPDGTAAPAPDASPDAMLGPSRVAPDTVDGLREPRL
ncbi:MAG: hypothetical protein EXR79_01130 [Myxococcales bacterium]|nr:hypothetical protein [Myxococcales bacterium]